MINRVQVIRLFVILLCAGAMPVYAQQPVVRTLATIEQPVFKKDTISITKFGAIADGVTLNTTAINNAIDACAKKGGGVVLVPTGMWLTGPVVLKSNVNLHLQKNAVLQFTEDFNQYPLVQGNWEGLPQMRNQSPISATNATNIAITGHGIIDGAGDAWRMVKKDKLTESNWKKLINSGGVLSDDKRTWYPTESSLKGSKLKNPGAISPEKTAEFYKEIKDFLRPNMLVLANCSKILLEGVTFQNSPAWCLHPLMSEHISIRNVQVKNPWYAQNGDGLDLESCSYVLVENTTFDVGDDGICIKSGRDEEGRKRGMPTENVVVRNCTVYHAHGGFVIGSEMSGGAKNIFVENCTFIGTDIGLRFKTTRGRGGIVENIFINNITMRDIVGEAILFDMYYAAQDPIALSGEKREAPQVQTFPVTEATPQFRNFYIKNVVANGAEKAIFVRGLPEMNVKNIVLQDMVLQAKHGIEMTEGTDITVRNVKLITKEKNPVLDVRNSQNIIFDKIDSSGATAQTNAAASQSKTYSAQSSSQNPAKPLPWSQQLSQTAMSIWKDSFSSKIGNPARWSYDQGVILKGMEGVWNMTGNGDYFRYIQKQMDHFVQEDGTIKGYHPDEYNIDHVNNGKVLLLLYRVTGKEKYKKAVDHLREQLKTHPRTAEGGFWHKKVYPYQMWLDGLYMGQPFYAEYAMLFHEDTAFNDITRQFVLMEKHARDAKTGLLYHGWDESKQQRWADKNTGLSPHFWGRALGWYGMAMVDALDYFPANHPGRDSIIKILNRYAKAVVAYQDKSGLWFDIVNMQTTPKNYKEASASCMMVYALAKGVRKGYLPATYLSNAQKGFEGIVKEFIEVDSSGRTNLKGTVSVSGLGGNPYRDGSFDYYMSEKVVVNDPKGMGAFIKCAVEIEMLQTLSLGKGKTAVLDYYFNNEWRKDATGTDIRWHYTWDDKMNGGFAMLGDIFNMHGVKTTTLQTAPDGKNLQKADFYIIVDPDTKKENPNPHFIEPAHAKAIADWVKAGGVLVLMGNDMNNAEFEHWNQLGAQFGIQFNMDNYHTVVNDQYKQGEFAVPENHPVFKTAKKLFVKELATINLTNPSNAVFTDDGKVIMAAVKHGKGTVFAIGDPWLYNEYVDGRKLPAEYDNYKAAADLVKWLIKQSPKK